MRSPPRHRNASLAAPSFLTSNWTIPSSPRQLTANLRPLSRTEKRSRYCATTCPSSGLRDNCPFGRPGYGEFGTYFIGCSRSPRTIEQMLENMFVGRPPGNYDRLLDFSHAVTGNLFFAPSLTFLEAIGEDPPAVAATPIVEPATVEGSLSALRKSDGSLGIGSLKGEIPHE